MYDFNKLKVVTKCPIANVCCCRAEHSWNGFGCYCCTVVTRGSIEDLPEWKEEYVNDYRYEE